MWRQVGSPFARRTEDEDDPSTSLRAGWTRTIEDRWELTAIRGQPLLERSGRRGASAHDAHLAELRAGVVYPATPRVFPDHPTVYA